MTIFAVGDRVRRIEAPEGFVYDVEEVTGDEYRVTRGQGDGKKTVFFRGFELERAPSNEEAKPEAERESAGGMDLGGPAAPADQEAAAAEKPTFNQIPPPSELERDDAEDNPPSHGTARGIDE